MNSSALHSQATQPEVVFPTRGGLVAVLRAADARAYAPVVEELLRGGISTIELTLTTPGCLRELPRLKGQFGEAQIGIGTVLHEDDARASIDQGADFLVAPNLNPRALTVAVEARVPIAPGIFTPTEAQLARELGASVVKLFPAGTVGPSYLGHIRGPFPDIAVIPSGGIELNDIAAWAQAGSVAISLGGSLIGDSLRGGDLAELRKRIRTATTALERVVAR